ncbi:(2Fe-2S) ferredoxin domain-containing protein [Burkholderiales bacterium]|nr:(2Fe-2S) ferredoxin domain-containing protein [Burkholderiales bacterium]
MGFYQHHVFFCCNQRTDGRSSCNDQGSQALRDYAKAKIKSLGLAGAGRVRINQSGCLDRCNEGPVMVVYPEEVWYTFIDEQDIDDIIDQHLVAGKIVERLKI